MNATPWWHRAAPLWGKLTDAQIADRCGVVRQTVATYRSNHGIPRVPDPRKPAAARKAPATVRVLAELHAVREWPTTRELALALDLEVPAAHAACRHLRSWGLVKQGTRNGTVTWEVV